jgi:hypothetical protein
MKGTKAGPGERILKKGDELLSCPLATEEFEDRATRLAIVHEAYKVELDNQDMAKKEMKLALAKLEEERDQLARVVKRRAEDRTVAVELRANDLKGTVYTLRLDTGEVINERPMKDDERQSDMGLN